MKKLLFIWFAAASALLFTVTASAYSAYIDPSAMTYIIQMIAGIAIAAGAGLGFYFRRIKRAFGKLGKKKDGAAVNDASLTDDFDDDDDDDDYGFGDYELPTDNTAPQAPPAAEPAATPASTAIPAAPAAASAPAEPFHHEVHSAPAVVYDKYDETGGDALAALAAENNALRAELAREHEKVEILIKALAVCTQKD